MRPTMDDLSTISHEDVLAEAEKRTGRVLYRDRAHYSQYNGTAGFPTSAGTWVRLAWVRPGAFSAQSWTGLEASVAIEGVPRPNWFAASMWHDEGRGVVWRADEMSLATSPALSPAGTVDRDPSLAEAWWADLRTALGNLARHETSRVCVQQSHLSRRIGEVYGDQVDTTVAEWTCAHGDVGYANLTATPLTLLDWEDWGLAPAGWDAACLWSASLPVPVLAARVLNVFADVLNTRTGQLSRLMLCANVARAYRRTGKAGPLTGAMEAAAAELLASLS
ncbi:aminoglycoside phosphotransferase [Streptomyces sp. NPDC048506]|uniref:aminoglycoside phosphotransferase n=1 Tax=Streptomyces sp. NPDC048506 TaxID=3155028 RepID=UPI00343E3F42